MTDDDGGGGVIIIIIIGGGIGGRDMGTAPGVGTPGGKFKCSVGGGGIIIPG
jgi:hypothetical protein